MQEQICNPNLPRGKVNRVIIGSKYIELEPALQNLGVQMIALPPIPEVDERLSGHVDLAVLHYVHKFLVNGAVAAQISQLLRSFGCEVELFDTLSSEYPHDAVMNACVMGKHIIHRRDISPLCDCAGFIHVRQGYSKCNICTVSENALITSDVGIARSCREVGIDVLLIEHGQITLDGFDTGFIGGAAFKLSPHIMAFTGTLEHHVNFTEILNFLKKYSVEPIYLSNRNAFDIGSAILLTELIN